MFIREKPVEYEMVNGMSECKLQNDKGKTIFMGPLDLVFRYVKHHCGDGVYAVVGSNANCTLERKGGIVYPTSGTVAGVQFPPRSLDEAKTVFGKPGGRSDE